MPTRIIRLALVLTLAIGGNVTFGQTSGATVSSPKIILLVAATSAQQSDSLKGPESIASPNAQDKDQVDASKSPSDVSKPDDSKSSLAELEASKPDDSKSEESKSEPAAKGSTSGGLRPRPSNDVLDAISAPNTITEGTVPENAAAKRGLESAVLQPSRGWMLRQVCWQSANVCHQPLYFEDAMLERHGHERFPVIQPVVSGTKFIATIALLPYLTTLHHPCENRYALGHFRPGSCAPVLKDTLPWDNRAAAAQALGITGVLVGLPW